MVLNRSRRSWPCSNDSRPRANGLEVASVSILPGVLEKAGELPVASFEVEAAFADVIDGDLDLVGLASRFFGGLSNCQQSIVVHGFRSSYPGRRAFRRRDGLKTHVFPSRRHLSHLPESCDFSHRILAWKHVWHVLRRGTPGSDRDAIVSVSV